MTEWTQAAETKGYWQNLDQRLPPQDVYVLICVYDSRKKVEMEHVEIAARIGYEWIDPKHGEKITFGRGEVVTHWMPVPDTPKKRGMVLDIAPSSSG